MKNIHLHKQKGFTLIEMILSMALITIIVGFSIPVYQSFQYANSMDINLGYLTKALRNSQTFAKNMNNDSTWGTYVSPNSIVVFKGASYATRDSIYDVTYSLASVVNVSGMTEVVFEKLTGNVLTPSVPSNINISANGITKTITINRKGTISF